MRKLAVRFPLLFALVSALVAMLCLVWPFLFSELTLTAQIVYGRIAICLFAIAMLTHLGWWQASGFTCPKSWRVLIPYLPMLSLLILVKMTEVIVNGIHLTDLNLILLGLIVYMAGGFMEEAVFRGLVTQTLLPGGLVRATLLSSLIFAIAHLLNLVLGANLYDTLLQVVVAFLIGLVFTAPLLATGNIWPLVIIHGLNNFVGYLVAGGFLNTAATSKSPGLSVVIGSTVPWLLLAIYSLWLINRIQIRQTQSSSPID